MKRVKYCTAFVQWTFTVYFLSKVNFTEALQQIHVDYNANNVTVRVTPCGNITIKWLSVGKHDIERIVMAISNASNVIGRFRNGEYRCYKDVFLTETECQEHYSLTVNASGDIIIVMRNISDPYFGSYLISVYRKSDDKIDTLWIKVYKKEFLQRDRSPTAMTPTVSLPHVSHTHTKDHVTTEENKPSEQPKSNGTVKNHISRPTLAYNGKEKAVQSGWRIPVLAISTGCLYRLLLIGVSWYKSTWENKI